MEGEAVVDALLTVHMVPMVILQLSGGRKHICMHREAQEVLPSGGLYMRGLGTMHKRMVMQMPGNL